MGATPAQASLGLTVAALSMGLSGIVLSLWKRMPISVAWSTPGAALLAVSALPQGGFAEAVGAFIVAGALTLLAGLWPLLGRLAASVPPFLAQSMLAGALLPICLTPFRMVPELPGFLLPMLGVWIVAGQVNRLAAVPATVLITAMLVAINGGGALVAGGLFTPGVVIPSSSLPSVLNVALPLFIVTMATQNIPGIAILRGFG